VCSAALLLVDLLAQLGEVPLEGLELALEGSWGLASGDVGNGQALCGQRAKVLLDVRNFGEGPGGAELGAEERSQDKEVRVVQDALPGLAALLLVTREGHTVSRCASLNEELTLLGELENLAGADLEDLADYLAGVLFGVPLAEVVEAVDNHLVFFNCQAQPGSWPSGLRPSQVRTRRLPVVLKGGALVVVFIKIMFVGVFLGVVFERGAEVRL